MKKLVFVIGYFGFLLTSCTPMQTIVYDYKPYYIMNGIDFSTYTQNGFLITPASYGGNYESIGLIEFKIMPGAKYLLSADALNPNTSGHWVVDKITSFYPAIDSVFTKCKKMGADGLMNFKIEEIKDEHSENVNPVFIMGYKISGFAIKRK